MTFPAATPTHPPLASAAIVVVCEAGQRWATAARLTLPGRKIVETRTLEDAWQATCGSAHGVLLIEVDPRRAPQLVSLLVRLQLECPSLAVVACGVPPGTAWELTLREAGADWVVDAPHRLSAFASPLLRHLARAPLAPSSLKQQIFDRLPWPVPATA